MNKGRGISEATDAETFLWPTKGVDTPITYVDMTMVFRILKALLDLVSGNIHFRRMSLQ